MRAQGLGKLRLPTLPCPARLDSMKEKPYPKRMALHSRTAMAQPEGLGSKATTSLLATSDFASNRKR